MKNKILVLGDICKDINYYGEVTRISPEAPIPIFSVKSKEEIPGMSGNIVKNLEAAENEVISYTKNNFNYPMTIKSRYFAGNHYLYRIDEDNTEILNSLEQGIVQSFISKIQDLKAVILQDYNKGFFSKRFMEQLILDIRKMNPNIVIIADGHKNREPNFYLGVDYLKLNEDEYATLSKKGDIFSVPKKALIITKGNKGAVLKYPDKTNKHFAAINVQTLDVTGAGDTFVSWFASEISKGESEEWAMNISCIAAGESVKHIGCYAPTQEELNHHIHILLAYQNE